jgi:hypothetical protein
MNKIVILGIICTLAIALSLILLNRKDDMSVASGSKSAVDSSKLLPGSRRSPPDASSPGSPPQPEIPIDGIEFWQEAGERNLPSAPPIRADIQNKALVRIDKKVLNQLGKDSVLRFTIPQTGASYSALIDRERSLPSGNRNLVGSLIGSEINRRVLITLGPGTVFATLNTPEGVYNLKGNRELAWVVASSELSRHEDSHVPDYTVKKLKNPDLRERKP